MVDQVDDDVLVAKEDGRMSWNRLAERRRDVGKLLDFLFLLRDHFSSELIDPLVDGFWRKG